jgi:DNA-binding transcriptional LysR family regulator
MPIDLQHLRYVIAAAQQGSFRRAAETLRLRQSTLSRRVRQLEDRLGVVLFERHSGGVRLTPAGIDLARAARRLVEELDTMIASARAVGRGEAGRLTVGFYTSLSAGQLRATLLDYVQQFPAVEVCTVEGQRSRLFSELKTGSIDLAIVTGDPKGHDGEFMPLWSERIIVALPEAHLLAANVFIYWTDLKSEQFVLSRRDPGPDIQDILTARLAAPGDRPRVASHDVSNETILSLVAAGRGVSLHCEASTGASYAGSLVIERWSSEAAPIGHRPASGIG